MNIAAVLRERARLDGDRIAIVERARTITFAELDDAASRAASALGRLGLEPGARVLLMSPMSIALYIAVIGVFRRGLTAVFADPSMGLGRLTACIERVQPDAFVGGPRAHLLRLVSRGVRAIPRKATLRRLTNGAGPRDEEWDRTCSSEAPAIMTFTSGATGLPKPAVRTHGFLLAQHRALSSSLDLRPGDVDLTTLPIVLLANLASGVTSLIADADLSAPGAIDPGPVVAQIARLRPTGIVATPALLGRLAAHAAAKRLTFDSVRRVHTGGAPVFPSLLDRIGEIAPNAAVVGVYGSTEAEPIARLEHRVLSTEDRRAMRSGGGLLAGVPASGTTVRVLPDRWGTRIALADGENVESIALAAGGIGEIVVTGDHVLRGYLDGAGDDEVKIRDGDRVWHRTGDAGYIDGDGRLWLLGRCGAKAVTGGDTLYPFAVEAAASDVPGLRRSAFACRRGRRILVVEVEGDARAIREALLRRLSWARLDDIVIARRVPVDARHNAKVDYQALHRLLARQ